jgi:hypothetical protein
LSDLSSLDGSCVLVIDDLHELSSPDALAQVVHSQIRDRSGRRRTV